MKEITVVARMNVKKGKEREFEAALRAVIVPTHAEAGCVRYIVHRGIDNSSKFVVVERWASAEALKAHLESAHVQKLFTFVPLLDGEPEILTYEALEEGQSPKGRW